MITGRSMGDRIFEVFNYAFITILCVVCVVPIIHVLAVSFSDRASTTANLVSLWPIGFNTLNYQRILQDGQFQRSVIISVERVIVGTLINMAIVVLTAYPLAVRDNYPGKSLVKWLLIFAMLFSGGMIPTYLVVRNLGLINSFWALVLPFAVDVWSIMVMANYYRRLPVEIAEAATMDGADHWILLAKIYIPLSMPIIATLALFTAVWYWNEWFYALIYMNTPTLYPLQTYLQVTVVRQDFSSMRAINSAMLTLISGRSLRSAQIFLAMLPIMFVYPFLQRYFVKGLTLGSVKG
jgi:putative aldouronate transport system permease protein